MEEWKLDAIEETDSWKKMSEFKKLKRKSYRIDTIFFLFIFPT